MKATDPELSIIVTVVDGGPALSRCLDALCNQVNPPEFEIIVPYDETISDVAGLARQFSQVTFLDLGTLHPRSVPLNAFTQHAIYDRRRAGGLRAAKGRLVSMVEDRGLPQPNWARMMVDLHRDSSYGIIGGAIDNGAKGSLRWALFFCDFGRFQPPLDLIDPEYVTDVNICYKREALEQVRHLWENRYQEAQVNWSLRKAGFHFRLSDKALVVITRQKIGLSSVVLERVHWGRVFGQVRGGETSPLRCLMWAATAPIMPTVLFFRHFRRQLGKRRRVVEFLLAVPATLFVLHCWVLGEFIGYCEAAGKPRKESTNQLLGRE